MHNDIYNVYMNKSKKYFILSSVFMLVGLILISTSILMYAFLGDDSLFAFTSIVCSLVSLVFFLVGGYFLYKYDQVHEDYEIPPRTIPSICVLLIFIFVGISLIYYLATTTYIESNSLIISIMITGIILDLLVVFVSSVMFISGIKEYSKNRIK